jgi:cobalt-zinc-cadmium resistance protein CzcA
LQEYKKYKNNIEYYEKLALPQADMIINQSTKSYKAGAMDYLAYIQSLTQALQIKNNYLESLDLYNQSVIAIEFIIGKNN